MAPGKLLSVIDPLYFKSKAAPTWGAASKVISARPSFALRRPQATLLAGQGVENFHLRGRAFGLVDGKDRLRRVLRRDNAVDCKDFAVLNPRAGAAAAEVYAAPGHADEAAVGRRVGD
jgi:hypothetical protein